LGAELTDEVGVQRGALTGAVPARGGVQAAAVAGEDRPVRVVGDELAQVAGDVDDLVAVVLAGVADRWPVQPAQIELRRVLVVVLEVAPLPGGGRAVRDSKDPDGPVLRFTAPEWTAFIGRITSDR